MYLLNAEVTLEWVMLENASPPVLGDLDLLIIDPVGGTTYVDAPILAPDYTPPTVDTVGNVQYLFTPNLEGLWRIRLVTGTASSYTILSKIEMFVFDNTTVTAPYNENVGQSLPYDINFYMQGYPVANELIGSFVTSRQMTISTDAPGSKAVAEASPTTLETVLNILKNGTPVGTITFPVGSLTGVIVLTAQTLTPGDTFQLKTSGSIDTAIKDIAVNIAACCTVLTCIP